jgi:OmcA/MtrC family decaheme c-type cytochrome
MEFPYPQNGSSCVTCHEGKLSMIFADSNFTGDVCTSCHAIDGKDSWKAGTYIIDGVQTVLADDQIYYQEAGDGGRKRAPALRELWNEVDADGPVTFHEYNVDCTTCHRAGGVGGQFTAYHTGYDPQIYDATGKRYSTLHSVKIDSVTKTGDVLNIKFSATNTATVPMLALSFYGYDTKDFLVSSHTREAGNNLRLEFPLSSASNAIFTKNTTATAGTWDVSVNLAAYVQPTSTGLPSIPELITSGKAEKVEISVLPSLSIGGESVALKAATATYDLSGSTPVAVANYFKGTNAIADDADCNKCHDALGTSFHNPQYGSAGVAGCRNCHVVTSGGSHLEMQSRSIDSYTHAIHAFQDFDPGDIDFTDPVEAARYDLHTSHIFPLFTKLACEGCHVDDAAKYDVPDQSKSMPGLLSGSDTFEGRDRAIGTVPAYVTGPGSRACGSCHKSMAINADEAGDLMSIYAHVGQNGYLIDNTTANPTTTAWVYRVIDKIMALF